MWGTSLTFFKKFIYLFYLWLCWVFISLRGLSPAVASGGHSSLRTWPLNVRVTRAQFWVISPPSCLDLWSSYLYFPWVFTHLIPLLPQIFTQMSPSQSGILWLFNLNLHSLPSIHPTLSLFSVALNTILPTFSYYVCICWYIHMYICLYVFSYITYSVFSYFIVCFPQTRV